MAILRFKTKRIFSLIVFCALVAALVGPYIFVHFPRTCIPYVDPIYQTGRPISAAENDNSQHIKYRDPRIVILSGQVCNNPDPDSKCRRLGEYSHYNRREYVAHHQGRYDLQDSNVTHYFEEVMAVGAVPAWAKIKMIKDELAKDDHDWIFWMDTDALFANMDIRLERFIDNRYPFIATKDYYCFNAGVFFLKNDDWSRKFIDIVWSKLEAYNHEQDWMIGVLEKTAELEEHKKVKYLPQCSFNSYWKMKKLYEMYRPGDFIIHWGAFNWDVQSFKDWQDLRYFKIPSFK
ncbi:hypothetical protein EMPS_08068 [Entomortierella parvispora]|uniref:Uncharacterized protein n=1 Tax=Entomortierella parvispora TaxID=205924 RepID=A0A9P3HFQ3_9FUNG|nr:hypothetical protein EMPS_08068 [Entomortierella parvispora]